jgi:hypothetical protein
MAPKGSEGLTRRQHLSSCLKEVDEPALWARVAAIQQRAAGFIGLWEQAAAPLPREPFSPRNWRVLQKQRTLVSAGPEALLPSPGQMHLGTRKFSEWRRHMEYRLCVHHTHQIWATLHPSLHASPCLQ